MIWFAIGVLVIAPVLIFVLWPREYCSVCGKNRAGRMVKIGMKGPICVNCAKDEEDNPSDGFPVSRELRGP